MSSRLIVFIRFLLAVQAIQIRLNSLLFLLQRHNVCQYGCTLLSPIVNLLTNSDQGRVPAYFSVRSSYTSTLFNVSSTRSLNFDYTLPLLFELSHKIATFSHTIITLRNSLNMLLCKLLVNKYPKILSVGKCLTHILPCFTLSTTPKNLSPIFIDLLEHEIFLFLSIFLPLDCLVIKYLISFGIFVLPGSSHTKLCMLDTVTYHL